MPGIAEKLKGLIGDMSVKSWAEGHDLPHTTVHDWIKFDRTPTGASMKALVSATGKPKEWWLDGEVPPAHPLSPAQAEQKANEPQQKHGPAVQFMAMASGSSAQEQKPTLNSFLLIQCLEACTTVYGDEFKQQTTVTQMQYAADLYNLLERMSSVAPHPTTDPLNVFNRLESTGMAEQLRLFIKLGWAKPFPPPVTDLWAW